MYNTKNCPYCIVIIQNLAKKLESDVKNMQDGLQPELLATWYEKIISDAIEMAPPWLQDKIAAKQDPILPQKFHLDISKRAVRYFLMATDSSFFARFCIITIQYGQFLVLYIEIKNPKLYVKFRVYDPQNLPHHISCAYSILAFHHMLSP